MPLISINLLPKNLQRRREPGYWRLIAIVLPILVLGIIAALQMIASLELANQREERKDKRLSYAELEPFIQEREDLLAEQRDLEALIAIRNSIKDGQIIWSQEMAQMLRTLPAPLDENTPRVEITSLAMRTLDPDRSSNDFYEGIAAAAEMEVSGKARNQQTLSEYIASLETSPYFGVEFQNASRNAEEDVYDFSLKVGAIVGEEEE